MAKQEKQKKARIFHYNIPVETAWLILIFLLAFFLRATSHGIMFPYSSGDEAGFFMAAFDFLKAFEPVSLGNSISHLFGLFAFAWGYPTILLIAANAAVFGILGLQISEFVLGLPFILLGSLGCILFFLIAKRMFGANAGLVAALFAAMLPINIYLSTWGGANQIVANFFFLLTIYLFFEFFSSNFKKFSKLAFISLGIYLCSETQFWGILPLLFLISFFHSEKQNTASRVWRSLKAFFRKELLLTFLIMLPLFAVQAYFVLNPATHEPTEGFLGHILTKKIATGNYLPVTLDLAFKDAGFILSIIFLAGFFWLLRTVKKEKNSRFLFAWFIIQFLPWAFLVGPKQTDTKIYFMQFFSALILMASAAAGDFAKAAYSRFRLKFGFLLLAFALLQFFLVWQPMEQAGKNEIYLGNEYINTGVKTAGYFFRENIDENKAIFTDFEPNVARYYFGRDVFAIFDPQEKNIWEYFDSIKNKADYIAIQEASREKGEKSLAGEFYRIAEISFEGKKIMFIYSREKQGIVEMRTEEFDAIFDKKYGNLKSLYFEKNWEENH